MVSGCITTCSARPQTKLFADELQIVMLRVGGGKMGTVGKMERFPFFGSSPLPNIQFKCASYELVENTFAPFS